MDFLCALGDLGVGLNLRLVDLSGFHLVDLVSCFVDLLREVLLISFAYLEEVSLNLLVSSACLLEVLLNFLKMTSYYS
jgi:hypothetical protein